MEASELCGAVRWELATLTSGTPGQGKGLELGGGGIRTPVGHSGGWPKSEADATGPLLTRAWPLPSLGTAQGDGIGPGVVLPLLGHLGKDL